jgi:hypothetical protein
MRPFWIGAFSAWIAFGALSPQTARAESINDIAFRVFAGPKHLLSSEGNASLCKEDQMVLKLRVDHGVLSNMTGTCKGPIRADGTFDGQCNLSYETLYFSGKATPYLILLHTKHVYSGATCQYDTELHWSP